MRIACVHLPHFCTQVERLKNPEIEGSPVIIGGTPDERNNVADCSEEAAAQGVYPGMPVREAYYLCPDALFLPFDGRARRIWEDILFALGAFALRIESERPGLAYLDITKASKIYKGERAMAAAIIREMLTSSGLKAHIGVGNSRFIAKEAASCAWDTLVIEPGGEKAFLSLLSIESLPLEEKEKDHLRLLGLSTLKKLAALSRKALISQFGLHAATLWEIVNGVDEKRPISRRRGAIRLEREFTGETPLETSGDLRPVMGTMIAELSDELNRMHLACTKIEVMLSLQDGRVLEKVLVMKKATAEVRPILVRLFDFLEYLTLEGPIVSFRISVPDPAPLEGEQEGLFRKRSVFAERLDGIKAYLDACYGYTPLVRVEEREEESRLPERRFRFTDVNTESHSKAHRGGDEEPTKAYFFVRRGERRGDNKDVTKKVTRYRTGPYDPQALEVTVRDGRPAAVRLKKRSLKVSEVANTWRIDEEWWRKPISRLYFLLDLENGMRLTVFLDLEQGGWYRQNWV